MDWAESIFSIVTIFRRTFIFNVILCSKLLYFQRYDFNHGHYRALAVQAQQFGYILIGLNRLITVPRESQWIFILTLPLLV
jgi:hypothetical protein